MSITPDELALLPERVQERLRAVNEMYLRKIGSRIKEIGKMKPSDAEKISSIRRYGGDIDDIERALAAASGKNLADIRSMYEAIVERNLADAASRGMISEAFGSNEELRRYVDALYRETAGEYVNMTQTTAFAVWGVGGSIAPLYSANRDKIATSLSETYIKALDEATMAAQMGLTDYNAAIRHTVKALADSGIRTVDYATGYSRRLDTAVRQNLLWGVRRCNQESKIIIGEQFGADGYEVSYHSNPRPSHEEMGGRQYAIGPARTVEGVYYPSFDDVAALFDDYNCSHDYMPIILGVDVPAYSDEELAALKARDRETFEYEGKKYTGYEATQVQRRIESSIRHQKDRATIAKASGDDDLRRDAQSKINLLQSKYASFTKAAGLDSHMDRARAAGFRRVKTKEELTGGKKRGIITKKKIDTDKLPSPMDKTRYKTMVDGLRKQGVQVIAAISGDDLAYLEACGAEAIEQGGVQIMHLREVPSASAFFEEIIHLAQERKHGLLDSYNIAERIRREIEACEKMLKNAKAYGLTEKDIVDVKRNLDYWRKKKREIC